MKKTKEPSPLTNLHSCIFCIYENDCSLPFPINLDNNTCNKFNNGNKGSKD